MLETIRVALARAREALQRRRLDREMDDEIRFHLEAEVEHNLALGMTPAEAQRAAAIAFDGVERYREATREARGLPMLDALARDTRLALRRMRNAPAFSAGVIATLAVGLGAAAGTRSARRTRQPGPPPRSSSSQAQWRQATFPRVGRVRATRRGCCGATDRWER